MKKNPSNDSSPEAQPAVHDPVWREREALREVRATLAALPAALRRKAEPIPVYVQARPSRALVRSGIEPDTMGLIEGASLRDEAADNELVSPRITLFLDNIWDEADQQPEEFLDEVARTYLHELGHYLGLEEEDLEARGIG